MAILSIVIPSFNERENIERYPAALIPILESLATTFEIIAVDDGSTDGTSQALEKLKSRGTPMKIVVHEHNLGLGAALRSGFARCRGEWIVTLDADLTFSPAVLGRMLQRQEETGADLISGSPFLVEDGFDGVPWLRRAPSLMLNAFYRGLLSRNFTAYTSIMRLYRAAKLKSLPLTSAGFEINAEIAARAWQNGWTLAEVPATLSSRTFGRSKMSGLRESARHARLALRLALGSRSQAR